MPLDGSNYIKTIGTITCLILNPLFAYFIMENVDFKKDA